jgi:GTP-binding protein Era
LILWIVDVSQLPDEEDRLLAEHIAQLKRPIQTLIVLNKVDLVSQEQLPDAQAAYIDLLPRAQRAHPQPISATRGDGMDALLAEIIARLPENPPYFPEDQLTDLYERDIAADLIREAALHLLRDEVPHGIAVRIDQYTERGENGAYVEATLLVEKETHKGIVIGQGGNMLKQIGSRARAEIESMSRRKIYLKLRVKLRKNWRNDEQVLKGFGYSKNPG